MCFAAEAWLARQIQSNIFRLQMEMKSVTVFSSRLGSLEARHPQNNLNGPAFSGPFERCVYRCQRTFGASW